MIIKDPLSRVRNKPASGLFKVIDMLELDKGYDPLGRSEAWDDVTREVIHVRMETEAGNAKPLVFLSEEEGSLLREIIAALLGSVGKVDIAGAIDKSLADEKTKVKYGNDPWPREYYRQGLFAVRQALAREAGGTELAVLADEALDDKRDPVLRGFFKRVLHDATAIFYSHPAAWAEIGFPGPSYPEGYRHLACDKKYSWEPDYDVKP